MKQTFSIITILLIFTLLLISLEGYCNVCKQIGKQQRAKYHKSWYKPIKPFKQTKFKTISFKNSVCNCTEYKHHH